jgi:hypothetical protein
MVWGVAGLKAGALQPFGPWFVRPSGRCFFCRRWRYGATGGTTTLVRYALQSRKSPKRVIGKRGSRWDRTLGPGMSVAPPSPWLAADRGTSRKCRALGRSTLTAEVSPLFIAVTFSRGYLGGVDPSALRSWIPPP